MGYKNCVVLTEYTLLIGYCGLHKKQHICTERLATLAS